MSTNRSPPKYKKLTMGGSNHATTKSMPSTATTRSSHHTSSPLQLTSSTMLASRHASVNAAETKSLLSSSASTHSLLSRRSDDDIGKDLAEKNHAHYHHHHYHSHHHSNYALHQHHSGSSNSESGNLSSRGASRFGSTQSLASKRGGKRPNWGSRERAGMSFLIVIAFFAIFGLIILAELFMIDDRRVGVVVLRRGGNYANRMGDSVPDYDNVKDDYDLLEESLMKDSKLGFVQFRDNTLQIQNAGSQDNGRLAGLLLASPGGAYGFNGVAANAAAAATGAQNSPNVPFIPWGKVLPSKIEETLPHFPIGTPALDGDWQIVNGTRFKFFVFSAYFDKRDGGRLVRVIGATKTRGPERVWCRFWYENKRNVSNVAGAASPQERLHYTSVTVMARVKVIRENWNLKYSACFVLCPVRATEVNVPQYVSVVARLRAPPGNLLTLRNTPWDPDFVANQSSSNASANDSATGAASIPLVSSSLPNLSQLPSEHQIPDKIAVCVKPFHFNYDQALYLMEYLEFYALLGVSHFTFYNHTIGPHAGCVLQHYMSGDIPGNLTATDVDLMAYLGQVHGVATYSIQNNTQATKSKQQGKKQYESLNYVKPTINILPWNMRMRSQKEIRTEGLFAALNDCLYRTMYRYKYLALVDLDEFIVPRHNDTLVELIKSLNQRFRNRNTAAYSFQNAFFYLQFPDDSLIYQNLATNFGDPQVKTALVTQRKTRRRLKLHPQKQRSKYICKPEDIVEAGNHFVWEFLPGKGSLNVPPTEAILQHYRVCEFGGNDCIKAPSIVDRTAVKYVNRLVQRVDAVYRHLKDRCDLPDLPKLSKQDQQQQPSEPVVNMNAMDEQVLNNEIKGNAKIDDGIIPKRLHAGVPRIRNDIRKNHNDNEQVNEKERLRERKSTTDNKKNINNNNYKNNDIKATTLKTVTKERKKEMSNIEIIQGKSNHATKTTTIPTPPAPAPMPGKILKKRRKIVVFENDEEGVPRARLMVVDDTKQEKKV